MSEYKKGYEDALAWVRALTALMTNMAKAEAEGLSLDAPRRRELDGAIVLGEEFARQIDAHFAEAILDKAAPPATPGDDNGTVH
jgi:hypothetical protein